MARIGNVSLEKFPALVLTITDSETSAFLRKARRLGAQILEARIDRFKFRSEEELIQKIRALKRFRMPIIATIRSRKEGGGRFISDGRRIRLFRKILPWVDAIDLELSSCRLSELIPEAHQRGKRVILSYHNFHKTPSDKRLSGLVQKGWRLGADLVKLAVMPRKKQDVARLLFFTLQHKEKPLVLIAMGKLGKSSRLLAPLLGSRLGYTYTGRGQSRAPGQIPISRFGPQWKAVFSFK